MKKVLSIFAMCIGIFLCMLDTTVMNIALPSIQDSLHVTLNNLQWALNIYTILFASLTIPLSQLAERFGKHKCYLLALLLFAVGSLMSSLSTTLTQLIIGRAIQSMGAALIFPLSMTIGINTVSLEARKGVIAALGVTQGASIRFRTNNRRSSDTVSGMGVDFSHQSSTDSSFFSYLCDLSRA